MSREYKSRVVKVAQEFHEKTPFQKRLEMPAEDPSIPLPTQITTPPIPTPAPTPVVPDKRYIEPKNIGSINDYFQKIFCINLDRRADRWAISEANFNRLGITVERVSAVDGNGLLPAGGMNPWEYGCFKSHVQLLKRISEDGIPRALILEDDVDLSNNIQDYFVRVCKLIPQQWSMLYLGGNHLNPPTPINGSIARITRTYTTGSYAVTKESAAALLKLIERIGTKNQIDVTYAEFHKSGNCYTFYPGVAKQRPGFSDIQQGDQDYSSIIS